MKNLEVSFGLPDSREGRHFYLPEIVQKWSNCKEVITKEHLLLNMIDMLLKVLQNSDQRFLLTQANLGYKRSIASFVEIPVNITRTHLFTS